MTTPAGSPCRCDNRHRDCAHPDGCVEPAGTPWSLYFCPACDERRRDHILTSLRKIAADFSAKSP